MATLIQRMQYILSQKDPSLSNETRRIILKEALQADTLSFLYNHPYYRNLNFYGGTCLHMVYGLNRLSEDIDFDNSAQLDLSNIKEDLLDYFQTVIGYPSVTAKNQQGEWGIKRTILKFPLLSELGLSSQSNEALHLKVEISQHQQISIIRKTPLIVYGNSFVPAHFSLETMMAGKMIACLERNFQKGATGISVKGRDFYDLLWFMQQRVHPLEEKLTKDGKQPYTVHSAMKALQEKIEKLRVNDLASDLIPLFENRAFIEAWLDGFHINFLDYLKYYLN